MVGKSKLPGNDIATSAQHTALATLANDIRAEHHAAIAAVNRAIDHAMTAGDLLIKAKTKAGHGQWLPWLEAHCEMAERTAQFYMWLAKQRTAIEAAKRHNVDLTLRNVRKLLAGPKGDKRAPPVAAPATATAQDLPDRNKVVELIPPASKPATPANAWTRANAQRKDAFSLGALPVADEEMIVQGQTILEGRGAIEALTNELNGAAPTDPVESRTEDDAIDYLVTLLIEKATDAGELPEVVRDLLMADAASCAPAFRRPQRWVDFLRTRADEIIAEAEADQKSGSGQ